MFGLYFNTFMSPMDFESPKKIFQTLLSMKISLNLMPIRLHWLIEISQFSPLLPITVLVQKQED
jgi:hypothetical protein